MFFELAGTMLAGASVGLLVWAISRQLKGRLPKWLVPVSAGAAMFIAAISSEYSWFDRTSSTMPGSFTVAHSIEESSFYRPWTWAWPLVTRFVAVDRASIRTNDNQPDQRIVDLVFYGRWARTAVVPVLFDCGGGRQADIVDGVNFGERGEVLDVTWRDLPADDPVLKTACAAP